MRKLFVILAVVIGSLSAYGQEAESPGYSVGQNFIGADIGYFHYSQYSGFIVGASYLRNLSGRIGVGASVEFLHLTYGFTYPVLTATPFVRYSFLKEGPVALFAQFNVLVATAFMDSETIGVIWPNFSLGLTFRMSEHFTAFAQMGLVSLIPIPFGSGYERDPDAELNIPVAVGFTRHPSLGIYYTF